MLISELAGSALLTDGMDGMDGIDGIDGMDGMDGTEGPWRLGQPCWLG
jgi:hypothetical protein